MASGGMALAAIGFVKFITNVNRVDKICNRFSLGNIFLDLPQQYVAEIAILGDHFALGRRVLAIMATEAARRIEVPNMVWIGAP